MKMNIRQYISLACAVGILGLGVAFISCSTVDDRKSANQAAYSSLSNKHQALVSQGKIDTGMSKDAVRIALGNPTKTTNSNGVDCWRYDRDEVVDMPTSNAAPTYASYIGNDTDYNEAQHFVVFFKNGKVVSWK